MSFHQYLNFVALRKQCYRGNQSSNYSWPATHLVLSSFISYDLLLCLIPPFLAGKRFASLGFEPSAEVSCLLSCTIDRTATLRICCDLLKSVAFLQRFRKFSFYGLLRPTAIPSATSLNEALDGIAMRPPLSLVIKVYKFWKHLNHLFCMKTAVLTFAGENKKHFLHFFRVGAESKFLDCHLKEKNRFISKSKWPDFAIKIFPIDTKSCPRGECCCFLLKCDV